MAEPSPLPTADSGPSPKAPTPEQPATAQLPLRASSIWLASDEELRTAGIRAIEPPRDAKQAVRGSLFFVAEVRGDGDDLPRLTERVLSILQRTYYTARGNQPQVLAEAARSAQKLLLVHNREHPEQPARLNLAIAALLGRRLLLACEGGAFSILRSGSRVELYPTQPGVDRHPPRGDTADTLDVTPAELPDEVEVLRWEIQPGDALLLAAPSWAERVEVRTLAGTVLYVDTDVAYDAAQGLREQAGGASPPGLLLIFDEAALPVTSEPAPPAPPELRLTPVTGTNLPPAPQQSPRAGNPLTGGSLRRTGGGLPAALTAPPPVLSPPRFSESSTPFTPEPLHFPTLDLEPAPDSSEPTEASGLQNASGTQAGWAPVKPAPESARPLNAAVGDLSAATSPSAHGTPASAASAAGAAVGAAAQAGFDKARGVLRNMLPEQRPATPDDFVAVETDAAEWAPQPGAYAELGRAGDPAAPLRAQPFQPPPPSRGGRARLFILIALLIALLVPVAVGGVYWRIAADNSGRAEALTTLAQARLIDAQTALDNGDTRNALNLLSEAEDYAENTIELVGSSGPVNTLLTQIRDLSDDAANVQKLYQLTTPLVTFPTGSAPTRLLVQDQEIYILDPGRSLVERYRLDASLERVPDGVGAPLLRTGDTIDGVVVGQMIDIAWLPPVPGYDDKATLLVLDNNNRLFSYDPRVEGPRALTLVGNEKFGPLRQVETYLGRIYLADTGEGQMWRYGAGEYDRAEPTAWFNEALQLTEIVSLRIDGDVWLLMRNGQVLRYRDRAQMAFSLDPNVGLVREAVDLFVGDGTNPYLYIVDGGSGRLWVFDKDGVYQKQLAAPEGDELRGLSGIFIEDVTDSLFLLTSSALYKHPLPFN